MHAYVEKYNYYELVVVVVSFFFYRFISFQKEFMHRVNWEQLFIEHLLEEIYGI